MGKKVLFLLILLVSFAAIANADDKMSKELRKLNNAVVRSKNPRKTAKDVAAVEAAAELVYQTHPEETGTAHYMLGEMYSRSESEEVLNYPKAMSLLYQCLTEMSEDNKYLGYAYYNIGYMYSKGKGITQNYDSAYVYFDKAQQKNKALIVGYGKFLEAGLGVGRDPIAALKAYAEGIQAGTELYMCYQPILYALEHLKKGDLDKESYDKFLRYTVEIDFGDRETAYKNLRESAVAGYPPAMAELGTIMYDGTWGTVEKEEGLRYLRQAADSGYAPANHNYAAYNFLHEVNDKPGGMFKGKKVSLEMLPFYQRAAEQGYAPSEYAMGNSYVNGIGVSIDLPKGYRWLALAAKHGYTEAGMLMSQVKLNTSVKNSIDAEIAQEPSMIQITDSLVKMYSQLTQMSELDHSINGSGMSAEEGALSEDFYQSQYNRYARRVERELKADNPRVEMIKTTIQKMQDIVKQANEKGFKVQRSDVEDSSLAK